MTSSIKNQFLNTVFGKVTDANGRPLSNTKVEIYDVDMREWQILSETVTNNEGKYELSWKFEQLRGRGKKTADVAVKVFSKEKNKEIFKSSMDDVRFNASDREEININISKTLPKEVIEFDFLVKEVSFLAGKVAIADLKENDKNRDVTFLSKELEVPSEKIEYLVVAHRLQKLSKIPADIFYGLFRMTFPVELNELQMIKAASIKKAVQQAIDENIISSKWQKELDKIIKTFNSLSVKKVIDGNDGESTAFKKLLGAVLSAQQQEKFAVTYYDNEDAPEKFWDKLKRQPGFNDAVIKKTKLILSLNLLTDNQPELAVYLFGKQSSDSDLKEMSGYAKYSKSDWAKHIKGAGVKQFPEWVHGDTAIEKTDNYAQSLEQLHKELYPTTFFAARLKQDGQSSIAQKQKLQIFFRKNPGFELGTKNIHKQLASANFSSVNKKVLTKELKSLNRLYKLTDEYKNVNVLYGKGLFSSSDIVTKYGREQFIKQFANSLGGAEPAKILYTKAVSVNNKTTALITAYKMRHDVEVYAISGDSIAKEENAAFREGYYEMFADGELCECEHCQSVYSPAAYFVDMLAFIRRENDQAYDELIRRRPDLEYILLTCKNTNTPLPYIDLVNELLEKEVLALNISEEAERNVVRNQSFQTEGPAAELLGMPEHINNGAYEFLHTVEGDSVFSEKLPLDLPLEDIRLYTEKLGWKRYELINAFYGNNAPGRINDEKLAAELFGISTAELKIITGETVIAVTLPLNAGSNCVIKKLLEKTKLTYVELLQLLETYFLNPGADGDRSITISQEGQEEMLTCNLDKLLLTGGSDAWLDKTIRFVRLWKKTGWDIFDFDRILTALKPDDISIDEWDFSNELLISLSNIENARHALNITLKQSSALFNTIDTALYLDHTKEGQPVLPSLYEDIFKNIAVNDASSLCAVMCITSEELVIFENTTDYSLPNLSNIYRTVLLARALGISISDLKKLVKLTGKEVVNGIWQPQQLCEFLEDWKIFKSVGIKADEFGDYFNSASDAEYTIPVNNILMKQTRDCINELTAFKKNVTLTEDERKLQSSVSVTAFLNALNANTQLKNALTATITNPADAALKTVIENYLGNDNIEILSQLATGEMILIIEALEKSLLQYAEVVLEKAPLIFDKLKFSTEEILWMKDNKVDLGIDLIWNESIDFENDDLFHAFKKLYWLSVMAKGGKNIWIDIPDTTIENGPNAKSVLFEKCITLYGVTKSSLEFLCGPEDDIENKGKLNFTFPEHFRIAENIITVLKCCGTMERLGGSAEQLQTLLNTDVTPSTALSVQNLLRSKYISKEWPAIIKPISDILRIKRRDALTAWLIANTNNDLWNSSNDLYEYLLIDTEMDSCMLTSRIKQGISSIQLFIDRCLMNLEMDKNMNVIFLGTEFAEQWHKWRKQYRVWEANRKIFLYPENWIEPDLRDYKSPFFKDLESQLKQNEVTEDTAKEALITYLQKLDTVANLEMVGLFSDEETKIVHVFGRTQNLPHQFFYRKQEKSVWTAWEKMEVDIEGDQCIPVVWKGRLLFFWLQITEKQIETGVTTITNPNSETDLTISSTSNTTNLEIKLIWSEYKNGKWTAKKTTVDPITLDISGDPVLTSEISNDNLNIFINSSWSHNRRGMQKVHLYTFRNCAGVPKVLLNLQQGSWKVVDEGLVVKKMFIVQDDAFKLKLFEDSLFTTEYEDEDAVSVLDKLQEDTRISYERGGDILHRSTIRFFLMDSERSFIAVSKEKFKYTLPNNKLVDYSVFFIKRASRNPLNSKPKQGSSVGIMLRSGDTLNVSNPNELSEVNETLVAPYKKYKGKKYLFSSYYHPYICLFIEKLNNAGINAMYQESLRLINNSVMFETNYKPTWLVLTPYPKEDLDFSYKGSYSNYNWELFFHIPLLIATRLTKNQKFEEARKWFHFIFDPTMPSGDDTSSKRFWKTKPFRKEIEDDNLSLEELLSKEENEDELETQLANWESNPFNPHAVARLRISAYMRNTVMRYIDNLIEWGDQLFRRDTIESINEATQLYILASNILGKKQEIVPARTKLVEKSFYDIKDKLDMFSNVKDEIESFISPSPGVDDVSIPYFCLPKNDYLLKYWDTVADRLFKIRHCMNIDGMVRQLPLFEPPIDPALLVRATATGLDLNSILDDISVWLPSYRFQVMLQKANELCNDVKSLGSSLLSALEKKDGEEMALLRSVHELRMLDLIKDVKEKQRDEAKESLDGLIASKANVEERLSYYNKNVSTYLNQSEKTYFDLTNQAIDIQVILELKNYLASGAALIPDLKLGSGFTVGATFGGGNLSNAEAAATHALQSIATLYRLQAETAIMKGGYDRRMDEWKFQAKSAELELKQIDKQIIAAEIRLAISEKEIENHNLQIVQSKEVDDYMRSKFTNAELYDWMAEQLSTVYFQSYQLAYSIAKKAERCMQHELGLETSGYIQFGYWDSLKKGLLCGDKLQYDLRRLENAYIGENRREYEIIKHVSIMMLDPLAIIKLRTTGSCEFEIPEVLYDMDHPGQYFRRLKSVSVSLPCIAGPYTSVSAKLSLLNNRYRKNTNVAGNNSDNYPEDIATGDNRFVSNRGSIQSIATSNAQNDSGVFELNFRDERYLPFENTGAISSWSLELPSEVRQFDYNTISDVIVHVKYTAREGGSDLKSAANATLKNQLNAIRESLNPNGLNIGLNMTQDLSNEWHLLKNNGTVNMKIDKSRLPYLVQSFDNVKIESVMFVAKIKDNPDEFIINVNGAVTKLEWIDELKLFGENNSDIHLDTLFNLSFSNAVDKEKLEELLLVVKYVF